jgi:hypothetical protein
MNLAELVKKYAKVTDFHVSSPSLPSVIRGTGLGLITPLPSHCRFPNVLAEVGAI